MNMDKKIALKKLRVTRGQIGRMEQIIESANSLKVKKGTSLKIHEVMLEGYKGQVAGLRKNEQSYMESLGYLVKNNN